VNAPVAFFPAKNLKPPPLVVIPVVESFRPHQNLLCPRHGRPKSCAHTLAMAGINVLILDGVGGRARTDVVDGLLLDRGFQVS
jgi:hypothetical protein